MGTPNPNNLLLGAGSVLFDRFTADGKSTGFRHLGNVDSFTVNTAVEKLTKKNAMDGMKGIYAEVIIGTTVTATMAMTEFDPENLALAMLGVTSAFTQAAQAAVTDQTFGPDAADVMLDRWYDLGALNVVVTDVKQGTTTLAAEDYEVNATAGMIRLRPEGAAVAGQELTWSGSVPAITAANNKSIVKALAAGSIKGRLKYISADNQVIGPKTIINVPNITLAPDGDLGFISEEFGTFNLAGTIAADMSRPADNRYYETIYL